MVLIFMNLFFGYISYKISHDYKNEIKMMFLGFMDTQIEVHEHTDRGSWTHR